MMVSFSTPPWSRMEMVPLWRPRVRNWPSLVQAAQHTLEGTLIFFRELEGMVQMAKSTAEAVARRWGVMGLKARACTLAACSNVYFWDRSQFHTDTALSALPEAMKLPSRDVDSV